MRWSTFRIRSLATIVSVLFATAAFADGTTAYTFLHNDVGARAAALSGSFLTIQNDPISLFYNPAGIQSLDQARGSVGFFKHLLDINSGYVVYGQEIQDLGRFAAGVQYTNYGSFNETDDLGNTLGTFSAGDLAISIGYGTSFADGLSAGGALKFIHSSIAGSTSSAVAVDLGVIYVVPNSRLSLGASIRNLGTQLSSFAGIREDLPLDVSVGGAITPKGLPLLLNFAFHKLNEDADSFTDRFRSFTIGGEFTLSKVLQARIGFNNEQRKDLKLGTSTGLAGFSGGIGILVSGYTIDYSLNSLGGIGSLHRISIGTGF